jgi:hypothetical protein
MQNNKIATFEFEKPFVFVTFTGNDFDDESFEQYRLKSHKGFEWKKYAMVYDISQIEYVQSKYRDLQAKDIKDNQEKIKNKAIGLAIVAPSFIQRTFVKTIFLILSYPSKVKIFENKEEAIEWINGLLEREKSN